KTGKFIINTTPVPTILANLKVDSYPSLEEMKAGIAGKGISGYYINATQTAKELGDVLLTNVIMLGAFSVITDLIPSDAILQKLLSMVKEKYHAADVRAFNRGRELLQEQIGK
ncbi:MAG TPA: 2-oxoacid:acceptor oxidoreductase family protein, partial [Negativicutes bacterium]